MEDDNFCTKLKEFDVIFLAEAWSNQYSRLHLDGYENICKHRLKKSSARRDSGGLVCFYKECLNDGIKEMDWSFEDGLCVRFCKRFFQYE